MNRNIQTKRTGWRNGLSLLVLLLWGYTAFGQLTVTLEAIPPECGGFATASASAWVSGGVSPYYFNWSNGANTQSINNINAGFYSVTVTDQVGNSSVKSINITEPVPVDGSISVSGNTLTAFGSGGSPPYNYGWDTGQQGQTITVSGPGTYCATIVDTELCGHMECVTIGGGCNISVVVTVQHITCPSANDGQATAIVSGGSGNYSFIWNTGATSQTIVGLSPGVYTVTVSDGASCSQEDSGLVSGSDNINLYVTGTNPSCPGSFDGTASASANGGVGPYTFNWSNGASGQTITGLDAGTYYVTLSDANGCQQVANITLVNQSNLNLSVNSSGAVCQGSNTGSASAFVNGGTPPYTYQWSNGGSGQTITGLGPGTYTVTATDWNGCFKIGSTTIGTAPGIYVNVTSTGGDCGSNGNASATAQVNGGSAPYSYQWSNGASSQTIFNLSAGTYTVTVTDNAGCQGTGSVHISNGVQITGDIAKQDVSCFGGNDGSILVTGWGGTPLYHYQWNTGFQETEAAPNAGSQLTNLSAGTYTVTITDQNGCTTVGTIVLNQPPQLNVNISSNDADCGSTGGGSASASASGGTPPYNYQWSNGSNNQTITGLGAGTYTVTVTDANYCTKVASTTITSSGSILVDVIGQNVTCFGANDGRILASGWGGTPIYTFTLSTGLTLTEPAPNAGVTFSNLSAGTYTVTVVDANGCTDTQTVTISQPPQLFVNANGTNANCGSGGNGGSATAHASGGTPPYNYQWSNGANTQTITNLGQGSYSVTVTDAAGCTKFASVNITVSGQIVLDIVQQNPLCFGQNSGSITGTGWGGTPLYTFTLSTGITITEPFANAGVTFSNLSPGTYTMSVIDANGCTATQTITLTSPPQLNAYASSTNASCGGTNGTATASASGGTPPYSYQWNTGQNTSTIGGLGAGTYVVTITDANGCTAAATTNVAQPSGFTLNINATFQVCAGANNGTATASPSGGNAPYTYQWSNGAGNQPTIYNLGPGTYCVTVTDASGCTQTACKSIGTAPGLNVNVTSTGSGCSAGNSASATANVSGGSPPYFYQWSNGGNTQTINNLSPGTYTVTVTDNAGCTGTSSVSITPGSDITVDVAKQDVSCPNGANGSIHVSGWGGQPLYTYQWSTGFTETELSPNAGSELTNLVAGTYTVTVTDANGCSTIATIVINQPPAINVNVQTTDASCGAANTGSASATASGGTPPYTFQWSTGAMDFGVTFSQVTNLGPGTYTLTVTDANYCPSIKTFTISGGNSNVNVNVTKTNVTCFGGNDGSATASAFGGTAPYTYSWSNGATGATVFNLSSGTYTVTATDSQGCSDTETVNIGQPPQIMVNVSGTSPGCGSSNTGTATASATGGTPPYNYSWSNGGTGQTITNLSPGTYTVTVTDANGCTRTGSTTIHAGSNINLTVSTNDADCGVNNGSATVNVGGGNPPYSYSWSNGGTTSTITGLAPGTYTVTVTDSQGCSKVATATISGSSGPSVNVTTTNADCGINNGTATANAAGGSPPYSYSWSNGGSSATITGLSPGTYTVTVTDSQGCSKVATATISGSNGPSVTVTKTNITCFGGNDGTATASAFGGSTPYTYSWSNGGSSATITGLSAGTYIVTVTDASGCTETGSVTIIQPSQVSVNVNSTSPGCNGSTGSASASASGGTPPYNFNWSNGASGSNVSNLSPGTYTVTVTDANGCTKTASTSVMQGSNINVHVSTDDATCGLNNGSASASASGGVAPYSYSWSNGGSSATINGLSGGTYSVTVTDANGCSAVGSGFVGDSDSPNVSVNTSGNLCNGSNSGTATAVVSGGQSPYSYLWSTGSTSNSISNLGAGTYIVTVTDANGCIDVASGTITEAANLNVNLTRVNISCFGFSDGAITSNVSGGSPPYSYSWSNGASSSAINNLNTGTYIVTVTDSQGCSGTASATITEPSAINITVNTDDETCAGQSDGRITANVSGGTAPYSYSWSNGSSSSTIQNLSPGTYTLTVTDATGCFKAVTASIAPGDALIVNVSTQASCQGGNTGTATASVSGGNGPYTYNWSNGATGQMISGLSPGTYSVTVTNSEGCQGTDSAVVSTAPGLSCYITIITPVEHGNDGIVRADVSGGTAPYNYQWSNGQTTQQASGLSAGTYIVTITDALGCTTTCSVTLDSPAKLGDMVWNDLDRDGIMDGGEPGIGGVKVILSGTDNQGNSISGTTFTDGAGKYEFIGLAPGSYKVTFDLDLAGWVASPADVGSNDEVDSDADPVTGMTQFITLTAGECDFSLDAGFYEKCNNVTNPGAIGHDQTLCAPGEVPQPFVSLAPASGGSGALEYIWMKSSQPTPFNSGDWEIIPGATGETYAPGPVYEHTFFARCARRECCIDYVETNLIRISVAPAIAVIQGPDDVCQGEATTFNSSNNNSGDTYFWNFGAGASPSTSTSWVETVTWNSSGFKDISLTVTSGGCSHTENKTIRVTTSPSVCGGALVIDATVVNRNDVMVEWQMPLDTDDTIQYFIERSPDGENFQEIGMMDNPTHRQFSMEYEFMDLRPKVGFGWYRVRYEDFQGNVFYSNIEEVKVFGEDIIHVFPNPFIDHVTVEILDDYHSDISIEVIDPTGRYMQRVELGEDVFRQRIEFADLPKGVYFLKVNYSEVDSRLIKLVHK